MFNDSVLTTLITWVVNLSFLVAILPQVFLNYKIKSTKALSDLYLVGYFNGYAANFFYVFALNFHLAYKVRAILAIIIILIMVFQRFLYSEDSLYGKIGRLYFFDGLFFFALIPFLFKYPELIGQITGWALVGIWTFYQLPQIFRIYKRQSVQGFSFLLVSLIGFGNLIELFISYLLNYPLQTRLIAVRGIIFYIIFCYQFWIYREESRKF